MEGDSTVTLPVASRFDDGRMDSHTLFLSLQDYERFAALNSLYIARHPVRHTTDEKHFFQVIGALYMAGFHGQRALSSVDRKARLLHCS